MELGIDLAVRGYGDVLVASTGTGSRLDALDCDERITSQHQLYATLSG